MDRILVKFNVENDLCVRKFSVFTFIFSQVLCIFLVPKNDCYILQSLRALIKIRCKICKISDFEKYMKNLS